MLSQKTRYALKAMFLLAREHARGRSLLIAQIAEREKIPKKFLELILLDLKNHGLLQSKKGRGGGYALAKSPRSISVGSIVRVTEGPLALVPCASVSAYRRCEDCADEAACPIRFVMKRVRDETARIMDGTSLADALERSGVSQSESTAAGETAEYLL